MKELQESFRQLLNQDSSVVKVQNAGAVKERVVTVPVPRLRRRPPRN